MYLAIDSLVGNATADAWARIEAAGYSPHWCDREHARIEFRTPAGYAVATVEDDEVIEAYVQGDA